MSRTRTGVAVYHHTGQRLFDVPGLGRCIPLTRPGHLGKPCDRAGKHQHQRVTVGMKSGGNPTAIARHACLREKRGQQ